MKKFTLKLLLFCALPMVFLIPAAILADSGLHHSRHPLFSEWNDLFNGKIQADMLIMGSSRAWVHFSPAILDSTLKLNSYNLGIDGAAINLQSDRLKIYLRYNKAPKYIVHEVGINSVVMCTKQIAQHAQFLPYLSDTSMWRIYKEQYENASWAERYFPLYKYNNQLPVLKEGLLCLMGKGMAATKYKGYCGQNRAWDYKFEEFVAANPEGAPIAITEEGVQSFLNYISLCKMHNIKLIMVYAPFYYEAAAYIPNLNEVDSLLGDISARYSIPLLNYTDNYLDSNKRYFYNSQHLNKEGAELFSHMVSKDLQPYINPQAEETTAN